MRKLLILSIAFIILMIPIVLGGIDGTDAYYKLENATEQSGGTSLSLTGTPTFTPAKINDGINLDGLTQSANVSLTFTFTDRLTINFWFNHTEDLANDYIITIWNVTVPPSGGNSIRFDTTGHLGEGIRIGTFVDGIPKFQLKYTTPLINSQWYMVTLVLDGTKAIFYLNGSHLVNTTYSGDLPETAKILGIGRNYEAGQEFAGQIDDVSIFPVAKDGAWVSDRWNDSHGAEVTRNLPEITTTISDNKTLVFNNLTFNMNLTDDIQVAVYNMTLDTRLVNETRMNQTLFEGNFSWDLTYNSTGKHNINITMCNDVPTCVERDIIFYSYDEQHTFNPSTIEGNEEEIFMTLNLIGTPYAGENVSAILIYNGTKYAPTKTGTNVVELKTSVSTPYTTIATTDIPFYWEYNITGNVFNSTFQNQTLGDLLLIECGNVYNTYTLNISIWNATNTTHNIIVSDLDQTYQTLDSSGVPYRSFNFTNQTASNFTLCIHPNATVTTNFQIDYRYSGITFSYFGFQINLSNATKTLDLFVTDGTSQIIYNVVDNFEKPVEDVYITIERYDVGTNSFSVVELLKTDSDGNAIGRQILFTEWYRFTISESGIVRLIEGPLKLTSTTKDFKINLRGPDWTDNWEGFHGVNTAIGWNNATNRFHLNYTDSQLVLDEICLKVVNSSIRGDTTLYEFCDTSPGASGQLLATPINGALSNQIFTGTAWMIIGGDDFYIGALEISFQTAVDFFKDSGGMDIFVTLILVLAMFLLGVWHPAVSIILGLVGFGVARILGIHIMGWGTFIALILIGIIMIWRINQAK